MGESGPPLLAVEGGGLGRVDEILEQLDEAGRLLQLRQVADAVEHLEAAAGRAPRAPHAAWWTGMIGSRRAPDDQQGHGRGEVEPVGGGDPLPVGADHRAQGG